MKKILAFGAIVLAMMAGLLTACAGEKLAQEEIEQIVADVLAANAEVDTCKFDMEMLTTIEIDGGSEPGEATMVAGGTGIIDNASREMYMTINMIIDVPEQGEQNMLMENYFVDGWMYARMSIPQMGEQWMKMKMPEEMWGTENKIAQNVELLKTAKEVNFKGSENVNGIECYVVEVVPGTDALIKMMSQVQMPEMGDVDVSDFNLANLLKEMSIKEWIAKDSYLFVKTENRMFVQILPGDVGATEEDFKKMTEDIDMQMTFYDYNEAVSIELPQEAFEAPQMQGRSQ